MTAASLPASATPTGRPWTAWFLFWPCMLHVVGCLAVTFGMRPSDAIAACCYPVDLVGLCLVPMGLILILCFVDRWVAAAVVMVGLTALSADCWSNRSEAMRAADLMVHREHAAWMPTARSWPSKPRWTLVDTRDGTQVTEIGADVADRLAAHGVPIHRLPAGPRGP